MTTTTKPRPKLGSAPRTKCSAWNTEQTTGKPRPTMAELIQVCERACGVSIKVRFDADIRSGYDFAASLIVRMMFAWACYRYRGMSDPEIYQVMGLRCHNSAYQLRQKWAHLPAWIRNMGEMTFDRCLREVRGEPAPGGVLIHNGRMEVVR